MIRIFVVSILIGLSLISAWSKTHSNVEVILLKKSSKSWNKKALPSYNLGVPEITILKITIPPKTILPLHKHPVINAGVLLKGSLTVTTESGRQLEIQEGDAIIEVVQEWHYGENKGSEPAEIIVFYAGTKGTPLSIKK